MSSAQRAHARPTDPSTSHEAAAVITPYLETIKERVATWAKQRGPVGFIDEELSADWQDSEHSSYRTRRAELVAERVILDSGLKRTNSGGRTCVVWVHRDFVPDAPPQLEPQSKAGQADLKRRGHQLAAKLLAGAAQMRAEGRRPFADELDECARVMAQLAS